MDIILEEITAERRTLIELGLPPKGRPLHRSDLARAAAALALSSVESFAEADWPKVFWPWKQASFPLGTPRENLLRSAVLIVAAIRRPDRRATEKEEAWSAPD
jgi:hypothetical protein